MTPLAVDVNEPALAVDLRRPQVSTFEEAEPAGVDRGQAGAVDRNPHALEDVANLLARQYCREPMVGRWPQEREAGPLAMKRRLEEELHAAHRDGRRGAGHLLLPRQEEEVLPQVFLGQKVRAAAEVRRELTNRVAVGFLGPRGVPFQLHVIEHANAQWCHDDSCLGGPLPRERMHRHDDESKTSESTRRQRSVHPPQAD